MRPSLHLLALTCVVALGACSGTVDGTSGGDSPVTADAIEEAGTAQLDGEDVVVELSSGPVRLRPVADTQFFLCESEDDPDCSEVDEATFRSSLDEGDDVRVLGPNSELISPDAEQLPGGVWLVLVKG